MGHCDSCCDDPQDTAARAAVEGDTERDHFGASNDNVPEREPYTNQLYLDMDGVLADFDSAACAALGTENSYKWEWLHGSMAFWGALNANPNFFADLPPMHDALRLFERVEHLRPIVLTALPKTGAHEVDRQKRDWVARYLGADVPVITCQTHEKPDYCLRGDVLVDDRSVNREKWQGRGGHYVLHVSAVDSIKQLEELGVL